MKLQGSDVNSHLQTINKVLIAMLSVFVCGHLSAGNLNLSDTVLEVTTGVEPNVMILNDDSGSMGFGIMVPANPNGLFIMDDGVNYDFLFYGYAHPHPNLTPAAVDARVEPAVNRDFLHITDMYTTNSGDRYVEKPPKDYGTPPTAESLAAAGRVDVGVWRAWNKDYNRVYYNPGFTYEPWAGKDKFGNDFTDINPQQAPFDPYNPDFQTTLYNLTALSNYTTRMPCTEVTKLAGDCNLYVWEWNGVSAAREYERFVVNNFYPARYYTWGADDNNDGWPDASGDDNTDGVVDAAEPHKLIEIRNSGCTSGANCPTSYKRPRFDNFTKEGRSDCATDNGDGTVTCSYTEEIQNFANWFSYYRKRDLVAKAELSNAIDSARFGRIGYATLNNINSVNTPVASMSPTSSTGIVDKENLLSSLYNSRPGGRTTLRQGLYEVGNYFECAENNIFGTGSSEPGDSECPVQAAPAGECQANHAIALTDGYYNMTFDEGAIGDYDLEKDSDWSGGIYGDGVANTLSDIAMYFYARDLQTSLDSKVRATKKDKDGYRGSSTFEVGDSMEQHMKTHTIGFGVEGSSGFTVPDLTIENKDVAWPLWTTVDPNTRDSIPERIDDLQHAAINGRGIFGNASDPIELRNSLETIFNEIGTGEGAASAVAFNSQTIQSDSLVFRAFFNINSNTGDLVAQRVNPDGTLNEDINGNPIFEWRAAERLDTQTSSNSDSRVIITYKEQGVTGAGRPYQWNSIGNTQKSLHNQTDSKGEERLEYLRGYSENEGPAPDFRIRTTEEGKLGDIVHSTPVYVGEPPYTGRLSGAYPGEFPSNVPDLYNTFKADNAGRDPVVYVGANDGMLHAFDVDSGDEVFAYVPNLVVDQLYKLTDPNYTHLFYVDLTPSINDIFMAPRGSSDNSWNSVLIGGLGAGGRGYYALNITDPTSFDTEASAKQNVMWEFSSNDDDDLGYSFSTPLIAMSNADTDSDGEKDWVAIFGNGYNSTSADGDAAIYMLFIEEGLNGVWAAGSDFIKISTGYGKDETTDATPNGIGGVRGIDTDGDGTVDQLYAGDLQGNLYRFDISSTNENNWDNSNNINVLFKATDASGKVQPITKRPIVVRHPDQPGYIVITTTGSWMTTDDAISTDIQSIYGVWDNDSGDLVARSQMVEQEFTNITDVEHGFTVRTLTSNDVAWEDKGAAHKLVMGWHIDFDMPAAGSSSGVEYPGERAIRNLQLRGDFLFVNTVIPKSATACDGGAGGFELAFDPITGGTLQTKVVFDLNADGEFDISDNINDATGSANIVAGLRFDNATPSDAAFISNVRMTQLSDKSVRSVGTNTKGADQGGRTSWREIIEH